MDRTEKKQRGITEKLNRIWIVLLVFLSLAGVWAGCGGGSSGSSDMTSSLEGVWFLDQTGNELAADSGNMPTLYMVFAGSGAVTDVGGFSNTGGSYLVVDGSTFTLSITSTKPDAGPPPLTCTLTSSTAGACVVSGDPTSYSYPIRKISDPGACAGTWSGTLTGTGGSPAYTVNFTVDASGGITWNSGTLTTPVTGGLYCNGSEAIGFLRTGAPTTNEYNQILIDAALSGTSISGDFETDSDGTCTGSPSVCYYSDGAVSLTKQ